MANIDLVCFMCESIFKTINNYIDHIKILHGIPSIYKLKCKQGNCRQKFQNIYSFKRHLKKHSQNIIDNTKLHLNTIDYEKNNTESSETNLVANIEQFSTEPCSAKENNDYLTDLQKSVLNFSLQLHNRVEFTRKDVIEIQDAVTELITKPISKVIGVYFVKKFNNQSENINDFLNCIADPFREIRTEYKFLKKLRDELLYKTPTTFLISNHLSEVVVKGVPILCPNRVEGCLMDIQFQIKKYFETGTIFSETLENMARLKNSKYVENVVNGNFWKTITFESEGIVIPFFIYLDDFGIDDPLGSKSGRHSICGIYYSFPTIPQYQSSSLSNIFVGGFIKSKDYGEYGNQRSLKPLVDNIKLLETEGITLNIQQKSYNLRFKLTQIVGDNLALNTVLGYNKSFSSEYFCRICKRNKLQTECDICEIPSSLRNEINYADDIVVNNSKITGIKENSLFNELADFHVTSNIASDIMHDWYLGICRYGLSKAFKYFIYEKKFFSLETLNYRKQMFNYGDTEIGNISMPIEKNHIDNASFKMSASQMKSFCHLILPMIGDLVVPNNEVYKYLIQLVKVLDMLLLPKFDAASIVQLRQTISDHHILYKKLFRDTLKPKFHLSVHYPTIIEQLGPLKYLWCFRFESENQIHKKYAAAINSRVHVPLTLGIKAALRFSHNLITNSFFQKEIVLIKPTITTDIKLTKYFSTLNIMCEVNNLICEETTDVIFRGTLYKIGHVVTITAKNNIPRSFELVDIFINQNQCYFLCKEWKVNRFSEHLQSYIIDIHEDHAYYLYNVVAFDGPPIHFYYLSNGTKIIRLKRYFFNSK